LVDVFALPFDSTSLQFQLTPPNALPLNCRERAAQYGFKNPTILRAKRSAATDYSALINNASVQEVRDQDQIRIELRNHSGVIVHRARFQSE
jgi:hypothetical protein